MRAQKTGTQIRQDQILQAALSLIGEHGPESLSIARIARRIGVVPSAIYRHFEGKDAAIDALLNMIEARLLANIQMIRSQTEHSVERLRAVVERHVALIRENAGIPRIVFSAEVTGGNPQRKQRTHRLVTNYLEQIRIIIVEGQKRGEIRPDVQAKAAALFLLGLIQPAAFLWNLSGGEFDVTRHVRQAWQMYERAVVADASAD